MERRLTNVPPAPIGRFKTSFPSFELTPEQLKIIERLAETAIKRDAEASESYLRLMAVRLSKEPLEDVLRALDAIAEAELKSRESRLPILSRVLTEIRDQKHPLRHLREIITRLAKVFGRDVDQDFLQAYCDTVGHRTDDDIDAAYKAIREDWSVTSMPSPGRFLEVCGILRMYRDGNRPE